MSSRWARALKTWPAVIRFEETVCFKKWCVFAWGIIQLSLYLSQFFHIFLTPGQGGNSPHKWPQSRPHNKQKQDCVCVCVCRFHTRHLFFVNFMQLDKALHVLEQHTHFLCTSDYSHSYSWDNEKKKTNVVLKQRARDSGVSANFCWLRTPYVSNLLFMHKLKLTWLNLNHLTDLAFVSLGRPHLISIPSGDQI